MTLFQIIMVSLMGAGFVAILGFSIAFIVEAKRGVQTAKPSKKKVAIVEEEPQEDYNIRQMLAQLDEEAKEGKEEKEEVGAFCSDFFKFTQIPPAPESCTAPCRRRWRWWRPETERRTGPASVQWLSWHRRWQRPRCRSFR